MLPFVLTPRESHAPQNLEENSDSPLYRAARPRAKDSKSIVLRNLTKTHERKKGGSDEPPLNY